MLAKNAVEGLPFFFFTFGFFGRIEKGKRGGEVKPNNSRYL